MTLKAVKAVAETYPYPFGQNQHQKTSGLPVFSIRHSHATKPEADKEKPGETARGADRMKHNLGQSIGAL